MHLHRKPERYRGGPQPKRRASEMNLIVDAVLEQLQVSGLGAGITKVGNKLVINTPTQDDTVGVLAERTRYFVVDQEFDDYLRVAPYYFGSEGDDSDEPEPQLFDSQLMFNGPLSELASRICIAKPLYLQRTHWEGPPIQHGPGFFVTYTYDQGIGKRRATRGLVEELQHITPYYFPGEIIMATEAPQINLKYPVTFTNEDDEEVTVKIPITWVDMNVGGRVWATSCP